MCNQVSNNVSGLNATSTNLQPGNHFYTTKVPTTNNQLPLPPNMTQQSAPTYANTYTTNVQHSTQATLEQCQNSINELRNALNEKNQVDKLREELCFYRTMMNFGFMGTNEHRNHMHNVPRTPLTTFPSGYPQNLPTPSGTVHHHNCTPPLPTYTAAMSSSNTPVTMRHVNSMQHTHDGASFRIPVRTPTSGISSIVSPINSGSSSMVRNPYNRRQASMTGLPPPKNPYLKKKY